MTPARASSLAALALVALFGSGLGGAQAQPPIPPGPRGVVDEPCPPPLARPAELAQANRGPAATSSPPAPPSPAVVAYQQEMARRASVDWPALCRYQPDNARLKAAGGAAPKVVFMGDSITEIWARLDADFFTSNDLVGRGISGQVSTQNLLRFQQDVVGLHPKVVHIMIGTNDIAGNAGPTTYGDVERNLAAMVDLARANGIRVVLATVPPTADFPWRRGMHPAEKVIELNAWIRDYAKREHIVLADYHTALKDPAGGFRSEWSVDGVHPNAAGFKVMEPIAAASIQAALARAR